MRPTVRGIAILLGATLACMPSRAQEEAKPSSADEILSRVRDHYSKLTDYHFAHRLTATADAPDKPAEFAAVEFELAVAGAERFGDDPNASNFPISTKRCRMSARSKHYSMDLVANEQEAVLYVRNLKQFKRAPSAMRAIGGPTSATFFTVVHSFPTAMLVDAAWQHPRKLRDEKIKIADGEVGCHVIEAQIARPGPMRADGGARGRGEATASLAGSSYLLFLGTHGLTNPKILPGEAPPAPAPGEPITVLLWVDQGEPKVWKSQLREPLAAADAGQPAQTLVITDSYTKIETKGPLPDELFQFEIVEGMQEVEKFRQP